MPKRASFAPGSTLGNGGRYRIKQLIGKGGFGEAYLAHDTHLDRPCVIKRLVLDPTWNKEYHQLVCQNFAREARMLVRLNTPGHPNIPEIYEYLDEQHCLVMKYIAGQSLSQMLDQRLGPLSEVEALCYVHAVCGALVYMHSFSPDPVLHRDIKPSNILIAANGWVWLIDFGLAKATPLLHTLGDAANAEVAGTPGFTPLEQWQGAPETRSDVYALAATLWTLLTNRLPGGKELQAHSLRQINPAVRIGVERLVEHGMAQDVQARPSAASFFAALDALLTQIEVPPPPHPALPPSTSDFIGREKELAFYHERLAQVGLATITGPAGIGKTVLAAALAQRSSLAAPIFWHTFHEGEGTVALIWSLAAYLAHQGQDEVWRQIQIAQQTGAQPPPPEVLCDYLVTLLRGRQAILCLDSLHLVSREPLVQRLCTQLRELAQGGSLKLIITARTLPAFVQASRHEPLTGLLPNDVRTLMAVHQVDLVDEVVNDLAAYTGGNPQLLVLSSNVLLHAEQPAAFVARLAETEDIERYLMREVDDQLTDDERAVMHAVAVLLGYVGSNDVIETVLQASTSIQRALRALSERDLLVVATNSTGGKEYSQHAIVRSFYYAQLAKGQRQMLHRRAGEYYTTEEADVLRAARHFERAGAYKRAALLATADVTASINKGQAQTLSTLLKQFQANQLDRDLWAAVCTARGEVCALLGEYELARAQFTLALNQGSDTASEPNQVEAQARRWRLRALVGERTSAYTEAEADCRTGLRLLAQLPQPTIESSRLYAQLAHIQMRHGDLDGAEESCQAGLTVLAPAASVLRERVVLLERLATIDGERGRIAEASATLEHSLALARETGDPILTASVLGNLGLARYYAGQNDQALTCYQEGLQICEQIGDAVGRIKLIGNMGLVYLAWGDTDAALQAFQTCYHLSELMALPWWQAFATMSIGQMQYDEGQWEPAQDYLQQAYATYASIDDPMNQTNCLYKLGDIALAQNRLADAHSYGTAALALAEQVGSAAYKACALRVLGETLLAQGQPADAAVYLDQAGAIQRAVGDPYDEAFLLAALARLALAQHQHRQARTQAQASLELARERNLRYLITSMETLMERVERVERIESA